MKPNSKFLWVRHWVPQIILLVRRVPQPWKGWETLF